MRYIVKITYTGNTKYPYNVRMFAVTAAKQLIYTGNSHYCKTATDARKWERKYKIMGGIVQ